MTMMMWSLVIALTTSRGLALVAPPRPSLALRPVRAGPSSLRVDGGVPTALRATTTARALHKENKSPLSGGASASARLAVVLAASPVPPEPESEARLPWFFDPGTYGGVLVLTVLGLVIPFGLYAALLSLGLDANSTGVALSGIIVVGGTLLWTASYVFRVFSKKMTYGEQLRQYEDAVIQKRFEELQDDEVAALMSEIDRETAAEDQAAKSSS